MHSGLDETVNGGTTAQRALGLRRGICRLALTIAIVLGCVVGLALAGCETQPPFASCDLDKEVIKKNVCTGKSSTATGTTSCVVTKHPHCVEGICLSYFGTPALCTHPCTEDAECEVDGGFCWTFAEGERYCVPKDRKL